jgi:hypothetical protein
LQHYDDVFMLVQLERSVVMLLLQKRDAFLEKSVQALAADVTGRGSQRALLPPRAQTHLPTDRLPTSAVEKSVSLISAAL